MREVKAFIRVEKADEVIDALREAGVCDLTVIDVMGIGRQMIEPHETKYSIELVQRYSKIAKVEIVCREKDASRIVDIIEKHAHTGLPGDGMITVMHVETAVKIRTGARGGMAL